MTHSRPISVVVPTRDRARLLDVCLASLQASLREIDELIVVDSASADAATRNLASSYGAHYLRCDVPGASRARNRGWRAAAHDVIAFIDDDIRVDTGWAAMVARAFVDRGIDFITGRTGEPCDDRSGVPPLAQKTEHAPHRLDSTTTIVIGHSANLAVRRSPLEHIGGFDERLGAGGRFRAAEDLDLFDRLFAAGCVGQYEPKVSAVHEPWRRQRDYVRLQGSYGVGCGARIAKLFRTDSSRARIAARSAFVDSGLRPLAEALRNRWTIGIAARILRLVGTVAGLVLGLLHSVRDGHFGGRPNYAS